MDDTLPRLPLRPGQPVAADAFKKQLTPAEQERVDALSATNPTWGRVSNIAAAVKAVVADDDERIKHEYPVDPSKEPTMLRDEDITPIEQLTAQQRAEVFAKIEELTKINRELTENRKVVPESSLSDTVSNTVIPNPDNVPADDIDSGARIVAKNCPRCHWDMSRTNTVQITDTERYAWLISLHGARFKKVYPLVGGKVSITFRSLTPAETQLAYEQTGFDMKGKSELGLPAYYAKLWENRMSLSLEKVEFEDGRAFPVPVDRMLAAGVTAGEHTAIPAILKYITANVVPSESLMRLVGRKFSNFQGLIEQLEQEAERDFTEEISGQS